MIKLTVEKFAEHCRDDHLDYINSCEVITGSGIVDEDEEKILCSGEALYNFINEDPDFDGVYTESAVIVGITFMNSMT